MAQKTVKIRITGKVNVNGEDGEELEQYSKENPKEYEVSTLFARDLCQRGIASACSEADAEAIEALGHVPGGVPIITRDPKSEHRDPKVVK